MISEEKVAKELLNVARDLVGAEKQVKAAIQDDLQDAVKSAKNFMSVGDELKKRRIKYTFSTSPMPLYLVIQGGTKYAIVNKKYAGDADFVFGEIALGKIG